MAPIRRHIVIAAVATEVRMLRPPGALPMPRRAEAVVDSRIAITTRGASVMLVVVMVPGVAIVVAASWSRASVRLRFRHCSQA